MSTECETIYINTKNIPAIQDKLTLAKNREQFYQNDDLVSIFVLCYNRIDKTKQCVNSIIKYTDKIRYHLYLVDNGSTDGTVEFFETVPYKYKSILKISDNKCCAFALNTAMKLCSSKYIVTVTNDVVVTTNWLTNLIVCIESDERIGYVVPMSSNVSNLQELGLKFSSIEEMQIKALKYNKSDPSKWQERLRLINIVAVFRKEVVDLAGVFDLGFLHDFGEDDLSIRIRRAGYKLVLAGDTFIHHNHDFRNLEDKDPIEFQNSLEAGRKAYKDKYFGLDAWDDINNYEQSMIYMLSKKKIFKNDSSVLGINVKCGTPLLQIRNLIRANGISSCNLFAYTVEAKYYYDLQCVTNGNVYCDHIEFINKYYKPESFDFIVLGEPVNTFTEPVRIAENILSLVKKGGSVLLKLRNTSSVYTLLNMVEVNESGDGDMPVQITFEDFYSCLRLMGASKINVMRENFQVNDDILKELKNAMQTFSICKNVQDSVDKLNTKDYIFHIEKL